MKLTQAQRDLLGLISEHGPVSIRSLLDLPGIDSILDGLDNSLRGEIINLRTAGYIEGGRVYRSDTERLNEYVLTDAGRSVLLPRLLVNVAQSRQPVTAGPYGGAELRPFTARPGAMQAFTLPSLQGGQRVERRIPMLMGSSVPEARR